MQKHKDVLKLSLPSVANMLLLSVISYVDTFFITKFGTDAVTGTGVVLGVLGLIATVAVILESGTKTLMTRYVGAKSLSKASLVVSTMLITALILSVVTMPLFAILPTLILSFMEVNQKVIEYAVNYGYILVLEIPILFINEVIDTALISYSNTKTPMYLAIVAAILNALFDYIFAFGKLGLPAMGLFGIALSTVISMGVVALIHLYLFFGKKMPYIPSWRFNKTILVRVLKVSFPQFSSRFLTQALNRVFEFALIALGSSIFAAFRLAHVATSIAYMPGFAFASSGGIMLGQQIGAKNIEMAKKYIKIALIWGLGTMATIGIFIWLYALDIAKIFSTDPKVIEEMAKTLKVMGLTLIPFAFDIVYTFALNSAGLTKKTFKINMFSMIFVRVIPTLIGVYILHSYSVVLVAFFSNIAVTGYLMYKEFKKGEWVELKV